MEGRVEGKFTNWRPAVRIGAAGAICAQDAVRVDGGAVEVYNATTKLNGGRFCGSVEELRAHTPAGSAGFGVSGNWELRC